MIFTTDEKNLFNELVVQTLYGCTSVWMPDCSNAVELRNRYVGGQPDMSDFFEINWIMRRLGIATPDLKCKYSEVEVRALLGHMPERFNIDLLWMIGAFTVANLAYQKNATLDIIHNAKPTVSFVVPERLIVTFNLLASCGYASKQGTVYAWTEKASVITGSLNGLQLSLPEAASARSYVANMIETCPEQFHATFAPSADSWWPKTEPQLSPHTIAVRCVSNHWYRDKWHLNGLFEDEDLRRLPYGFSIASELAESINSVLRAKTE